MQRTTTLLSKDRQRQQEYNKTSDFFFYIHNLLFMRIGLVNENCTSIVGAGVVVHVPSFFEELSNLEKKGKRFFLFSFWLFSTIQCTFFFHKNGCSKATVGVFFCFCCCFYILPVMPINMYGSPLFLWLCGRSSPLWSAWFPLSSNVLRFADSSFLLSF